MVKIKKVVAFTAHVTNATSPLYACKQYVKFLSDDTIYYFKGEALGEYFVNFR